MTDNTPPVRVLFYVQHLLGIGHLARASRIAAALVADGFTVTMVTGGLPVPGFPGPGVDHIALPALTSGEGFSDLVDAHGTPVDDAFKNRRRDMLLDVAHRIAPDVVLIEAFPFGRRQVRFELLPLLDLLHSQTPKPLILSSVRDILQQNRKPGRDDETLALMNARFDGVLVHGDPNFVRLGDTYPLAQALGDKVIYTGLVAPNKPAAPAERFDIIASAGGGAVGGDLIRAVAAASQSLDPTLSWLLIGGPNLPQAEYDALEADLPTQAHLVRFRKDFATLLAGAKVSVSQAGYNTVCDILQAECQAVLVPYTAGGETEQSVRANRLAGLGLAAVVPENGLDAQAMAQAIGAALARGKAQKRAQIDVDGAARTAKIVRDLLRQRIASS